MKDKLLIVLILTLIFLPFVASASCQGSTERCDGTNLYICVNGQEFGPYQIAGKCNSQPVPDAECSSDADCGDGKICLDKACKFKTSSGTEWIWIVIVISIFIIIIIIAIIIVILVTHKNKKENAMKNISLYPLGSGNNPQV